MRKLPTIMAAIFLAITLARVGQFSAEAMRAGALGWLFAGGLGVSVYTAAYWTRLSASRGDGEDRRSQAVRRSAYICLVLFVFVDGWFNLADVLRLVNDPDLYPSAVIYGLFPTLAAGVLGWLQGNVDRLPVPPAAASRNVSGAVRAALVTWVNARVQRFVSGETGAGEGDGLAGRAVSGAGEGDGLAGRAVSGVGQGDSPAGTDVLRRDRALGGYAGFVLLDQGRNGQGPMTARDIVTHFGVSRKTAYRWLKKRSG